MVAPTVTLIDPNTGHPGGQSLLSIEGSDFQLPLPPPPTGYVGGDVGPTVEVEVDGVLAEDVKVFSSTHLTCILPAFTGEPDDLENGLDVDVVVRNLGPPVEETTVTDGLTYQRTNLARADGVLVRIIRKLIRDIRRQVINNVSISTEMVYDKETGDAYDVVQIAEPPGIGLYGPGITEDIFQRTGKRTADQNIPSQEVTKYEAPWYAMLSFEGVIVVKDSMIELGQLVQEVIMFFRRNPYLKIDIDSTDPDQGQAEIPLWLTSAPDRNDTVNFEGTLSAAFAFELRGIPVDDDTWVPVEWTTIMGDPADIEIGLSSKE